MRENVTEGRESMFDAAVALADEIDEAYENRDDPFFSYPWEHLGDAEKDVFALIAGIREAQKFFDRGMTL